MPAEPPLIGDHSCVVGSDLAAGERIGPIARDPKTAVCDSSKGLAATFTACLTMSSVACATSQM
jgi:hypothetical protein